MPGKLDPGVLYVSEQLGAAAHLCACGCGSRVRTPIGPTDWSVKETDNGPTLWPSVGSWQQACKSHYLITRGEIVWAPQWTDEQIANGRLREEERAREYYEALYRKRLGVVREFGVGSTAYLGGSRFATGAGRARGPVTLPLWIPAFAGMTRGGEALRQAQGERTRLIPLGCSLRGVVARARLLLACLLWLWLGGLPGWLGGFGWWLRLWRSFRRGCLPLRR